MLDIGSQLPREFQLRVTRGPSAGVTVRSTGTQLSVGRAPENDLVLNDLLISGHHLIVQWNEGSYWVRFAGALNGLFSGGRAPQPSVLRDGSELMLGATTMRFELL